VARGIAVGRIAAGVALLVAPRPVAKAWVGDAGDGPAAAVLTRAVGIRDLIMGAITLHTVTHPQVGPRWVATCAVADAVDAAASFGARRALPDSGVAGVTAMGAGSAVAGLVTAVLLRA
jgi:hypothetical protein